MDTQKLLANIATIEKALAEIKADVSKPDQPQPESGFYISPGAKALNLEVVSQSATPGYKLVDLFTTEFGSREEANTVYSITPKMREKYLAKLPLTGGAHHMYAVVLDAQGKGIEGVEVLFSNTQNYQRKVTDSKGIAEYPINDSFNPDNGEHGDWSFTPTLSLQWVSGFALPNNRQVSIFGVWQKVN